MHTCKFILRVRPLNELLFISSVLNTYKWGKNVYIHSLCVCMNFVLLTNEVRWRGCVCMCISLYFLDINTLECWDSRFPGLFTVCRGSFFSKRALCKSQRGCRMLGGVRLSSCFCSPPLIDADGLYHAQKEQRETNRTSTERKLDLAEDTVRGKAAAATFTEDTSTS